MPDMMDGTVPSWRDGGRNLLVYSVRGGELRRFSGGQRNGGSQGIRGIFRQKNRFKEIVLEIGIKKAYSIE